jgi:hypothetical protein
LVVDEFEEVIGVRDECDFVRGKVNRILFRLARDIQFERVSGQIPISGAGPFA